MNNLFGMSKIANAPGLATAILGTVEAVVTTVEDTATSEKSAVTKAVK
jgi:hypothetical protein